MNNRNDNGRDLPSRDSFDGHRDGSFRDRGLSEPADFSDEYSDRAFPGDRGADADAVTGSHAARRPEPGAAHEVAPATERIGTHSMDRGAGPGTSASPREPRTKYAPAAGYAADDDVESRTVAEGEKSGGKLPLRALAMVVVAIALMLLAWGLYSALKTNDKGDDKAGTAATSSVAAVPSQSAAQSPAQSPAPSPAPSGAPSPAPSPAPNGDPNKAPAAAPAPAPAPGPAPAQGAAPAGVDPKTVPVQVLNNSTVQGLANRVSGDLGKSGWKTGAPANYHGENLPKSVAYFTPGNAAEEQAARGIADQLHIGAQPRPAGFQNPGGVTVVVTQDLNK